VSWISGTFDEPSARALLAAFVAELG
jgi:hypothetical protein